MRTDRAGAGANINRLVSILRAMLSVPVDSFLDELPAALLELSGSKGKTLKSQTQAAGSPSVSPAFTPVCNSNETGCQSGSIA